MQGREACTEYREDKTGVEGKGQRTEGSWQRTEDRVSRKRTEDRGQVHENRGQCCRGKWTKSGRQRIDNSGSQF